MRYVFGGGCTLSLVIIAVLACGIIALMGILLQTVYAFTREIPVAEVIMGPIQQDESGEYMVIEFKPYQYSSALASVFNRDSLNFSAPEGTPETYKIYGDVVSVNGPLIKLHPFFQFLGFENVYKLSLIEGEYRRPNAIENGDGSEYPLGGGFNPLLWDFNTNAEAPPYNLLIDRFTFSGDEEPGFFGQGRKRYEIVVTMDTITWNFIENLP